VRDDELEEELRPARGVELGRPLGQRISLEAVKKLLAAERPVDDDRAASGRRRRSASRSTML
jgi:hypothetical protein